LEERYAAYKVYPDMVPSNFPANFYEEDPLDTPQEAATTAAESATPAAAETAKGTGSLWGFGGPFRIKTINQKPRQASRKT